MVGGRSESQSEMDLMKRILNSPALSRRSKTNTSFRDAKGGEEGEEYEAKTKGRSGGGGALKSKGGYSATLPARFNAPVEAGGQTASPRRYFGVALDEILAREDESCLSERGNEVGEEGSRLRVPNLVRAICEFIVQYGE